MCDIKIFDDEKHKKYTGVSNKEVLKNMTDEMMARIAELQAGVKNGN